MSMCVCVCVCSSSYTDIRTLSQSPAYANDILDNEPNLVAMPGKPLTIELLDKGHMTAKAKTK